MPCKRCWQQPLGAAVGGSLAGRAGTAFGAPAGDLNWPRSALTHGPSTKAASHMSTSLTGRYLVHRVRCSIDQPSRRGPDMNLITGATGLLGSHIAEQLVAAGQPVRALVRPSSDTSFLDSLGVEKALGDVTQPDSLDADAESAATHPPRERPARKKSSSLLFA